MTLVKVRLVGAGVRTAGVPTADPVKGIARLGFEAFEVTVTVPVKLLAEGGVNVTVIVQFEFAASDEVQVPPVTEYSALGVGVRLIALFRLFVTVTVAEEVDPTATLGKVKLVGLNVSGATAVPVIFTICGLVEALSTIVSAPMIDATSLGAKLTLIVQLLDAARDEPQLFVCV